MYGLAEKSHLKQNTRKIIMLKIVTFNVPLFKLSSLEELAVQLIIVYGNIDLGISTCRSDCSPFLMSLLVICI